MQERGISRETRKVRKRQPREQQGEEGPGQMECHVQRPCGKQEAGLLVGQREGQCGELGKVWQVMMLEGGQGEITQHFVSQD